MRSDDLDDIAVIINHYFILEEKLIYEQHIDLFTVDFHDLKLLSARVLGREIRLILQKNELLRTRILTILAEEKKEIQRKFRGILVDDDSPGLPDYHEAIIQEMEKGIEENKYDES